MSYLLLTNKSTNKISIPELHVFMPCRGSTATVLKHEWDACSAAIPYKSLVSVTLLTGMPVSATGLIKVKPEERDTQPPLTPPEASSLFPILLSKIDELISAVKSQQQVTILPPTMSFSSSPQTRHDLKTINNPVFIPSNIIPDAELSNMKASEQSSVRDDLDDTAQALKRIRNKKK